MGRRQNNDHRSKNSKGQHDKEYDSEDDFANDNLRRFDESVVKIEVTSSKHNFLSPFSAPAAIDSMGSGFVIRGPHDNVILTNAHVVTNADNITVTLTGDPIQYLAEVIVIGHDCDLALIRVRDSEFQKKTKPLIFGTFAQINAPLLAVGFPALGHGISYTKGQVSRNEIDAYVFGNTLISSQITAQINPGSSGGPVFSDGKVVGVAYKGEKVDRGSIVGSMIPIPVVAHFLEDIDSCKEDQSKYRGFPDLLIKLNGLTNPHVRHKYNVPPNVHGALVTEVPKYSCVSDILLVGDVITHIEGYPIGNDGTITLGPHFNIQFKHLINMKHIGDKIKLQICRNEQILPPIEVVLTQKQNEYKLVPANVENTSPSYVFANGFCFTALTGSFIQNVVEHQEQRDEGPHIDPAYFPFINGIKEKTTDQGVVLTQFFPHPSNHMYKNAMYSYPLVTKINGQPIKNLEDVIRASESNTKPYFTISLADDFSQNEIVVGKLSKEEHRLLLEKHGIANDRSIHFRANAPRIMPTPIITPPQPERPIPILDEPARNFLPNFVSHKEARATKDDRELRSSSPRDPEQRRLDPRRERARSPHRDSSPHRPSSPRVRTHSRGDKDNLITLPSPSRKSSQDGNHEPVPGKRFKVHK